MIRAIRVIRVQKKSNSCSEQKEIHVIRAIRVQSRTIIAKNP